MYTSFLDELEKIAVSDAWIAQKVRPRAAELAAMTELTGDQSYVSRAKNFSGRLRDAQNRADSHHFRDLLNKTLDPANEGLFNNIQRQRDIAHYAADPHYGIDITNTLRPDKDPFRPGKLPPIKQIKRNFENMNRTKIAPTSDPLLRPYDTAFQRVKDLMKPKRSVAPYLIGAGALGAAGLAGYGAYRHYKAQKSNQDT